MLSQVKFGYVVFTEAETAERLFRQGGVIVRRASGERIQVCSYYYLAVLRMSGSFLSGLPGSRQEDGWTACAILPQLIHKAR